MKDRQRCLVDQNLKPANLTQTFLIEKPTIKIHSHFH